MNGDIASAIIFVGCVFICCCTFIIKSILDIKQERWKLEHKEKHDDV